MWLLLHAIPWDSGCLAEWELSQMEKFMGPTWVLSAPDGPHVGPFIYWTRTVSADSLAPEGNRSGVAQWCFLQCSFLRITVILNMILLITWQDLKWVVRFVSMWRCQMKASDLLYLRFFVPFRPVFLFLVHFDLEASRKWPTFSQRHF